MYGEVGQYSKDYFNENRGWLRIGNKEEKLRLRFYVQQERICTYKCNIKLNSRSHYFRGISISISYSKYVSVAVDIQNAKRVRHIILSSLVCLALPYSSILFDKRHDIRKKKVTEYKMRVLIFPATFFWNNPHSKKT